MENSTTHYEHLSLAEREEIAIGLEKGESFAATGRKLGRNRSSISREAKRNHRPECKIPGKPGSIAPR